MRGNREAPKQLRADLESPRPSLSCSQCLKSALGVPPSTWYAPLNLPNFQLQFNFLFRNKTKTLWKCHSGPTIYGLSTNNSIFWVLEDRKCIYWGCQQREDLVYSKGESVRASLVTQWLRLRTCHAGDVNSVPGRGTEIPSHAGDANSVPGRGTEIPHATWHSQKFVKIISKENLQQKHWRDGPRAPRRRNWPLGLWDKLQRQHSSLWTELR